MTKLPISELLRNRNLFIAIEGVDGAGKSTQVPRFADYLRRNEVPVVTTREPGGTPIAEKIRNLILASDAADLDHTTQALLISAARRDHIQKVIAPALASGKTVITDRFTLSMLMYQHQCPHSVQLALRNLAGALECAPSLVFILDVSYETYLKRRGSSALNHMDNMTEDEFNVRRNACLSHTGFAPDAVILIDANKSREQVLMEMITKFGEKLEASHGCFDPVRKTEENAGLVVETTLSAP